MTVTTSTLTIRMRLFAASVLILLLVTACSADSADSDSSAESVAADAPDPMNDDAVVAVGEAATPDEVAQAEDEGAADGSTDDTEQSTDALSTEVTAATGERVIKEGTVTIEVAPGDYDAAFGQLVARAQTLGGHVSGTSSSVSEDADGNPLVSGQITLRVPVRTFEDLLTTVGDAGEIVDRNVASQDVTAEYTDLESRRRNLQAQEAFYLGLLDQAATVADAIAVQQQLDDIQGQIEQITGRLNLLTDRTSFSTLTIRIRERGVEALAAETQARRSLAPYIDDAVDTFITTVGAIIVFTTFVAPFLVMGLLGYLVWHLARRGRKHPTANDGDRRASTKGPDRTPVAVGKRRGRPESKATTLESDDSTDLG
ncbi:DUF4349 domain-containing protein [soil metagenome]